MNSLYSVLFVCTGNLCRSPIAHGFLADALSARGLQDRIFVDSAGTHAREGEPPHPLAIAVAADYGVDIRAQRARQVTTEDFMAFDRIVALDREHLGHLARLQPIQARAKIELLLTGMAASGDAEVPDPYGRGIEEFEYAARLIDIGVAKLLADLTANG